jgi:Fe-S oxidoreductase
VAGRTFHGKFGRCGDSARRLGNECLFQTLAQENLELFRRYGVHKIVTICPHGFNTFKNEYPKLVDSLPGASNEDKSRLKQIRVVSHPELLQGLLKERKIELRTREGVSFTFHDSCYLGRHNGIIDPPRDVLTRALGGRTVELANNRKHSFCCGAGGGLMWTEENLGRRINHLRADEVITSGAGLAAASCPFCLTMLRDGLQDKDRADIQVKDIAQIVAEAML